MLRIRLDIFGEDRGQVYEGKISNVSNLAAQSNYSVQLDDVAKRLKLKNYARWSEPVQGLAARCISLAIKGLEPKPLIPWTSSLVRLEIQGGGYGPIKEIARCEVHHRTEKAGVFTSSEQGADYEGEHPLREGYSHPWELAEHMFRIGAWRKDVRARRRMLRVPVHEYRGVSYVDLQEIPEPARSAFKSRVWHSTRPLIPWVEQAIPSNVWNQFLNGG